MALPSNPVARARFVVSSTREAQSLAFTFSNYITELDEQRRKHGKIKQKDIGSGKAPIDKALNIRIQDLRVRDISQTKLPPERLHWMFRNYGFTSTKDSVY